MELELSINGVIESLEVAPNESLLTMLRREGYVSVKHGCESGECGACTVLVDGVARPACVTLAAQTGGCSLMTVESLGNPRNLHPLQQAFIDTGAIQCGFCTPGMLLSASVLLKRNHSPDEAEVREALSGNLCRCTGYARPVQAVLRAAAVMRGETIAPLSRPRSDEQGQSRQPAVPAASAEQGGRQAAATLIDTRPSTDFSIVGQAEPRVDAVKLATGKAAFVDDITVRDMLFARILTSPHAHALISSIDVSEALALPGVHAVLTHKDVTRVPYTTSGQSWPESGARDQYALDNHVRFVGDRVAVVAAESQEIAEQALHLIQVEYEILPAVLDARLATSPQAPSLHPEAESSDIHDAAHNIAAFILAEVGDVERGFAQSDLIVEGEYVVPQVQQVPMENHVAITYWDEDERLVVRSNTQVPYQVRRTIAPVIGLPPRRIRVMTPRIGGSFGARQEVVIEDLCALLTLATNRPVRLEYSRAEEFRSSRSRHSQIIHMKTGVRRDGTIVANSLRSLANTGAYGAHALTVQSNTGASTLPLYPCANLRFESQVVYTNLPPAGAFQGYGAPQGFFALECHMDEIARQLGMDALELRRKNWIQTGAKVPLVRELSSSKAQQEPIIQSCGLSACLEKVEENIGWREKRGQGGVGRFRRGVGVALAMQGTAFPGQDMAGVSLKLNEDGSFDVMIGAVDSGTGSDTLIAQIVAEVLGVRMEDLIIHAADTDFTPFATATYAISAIALSGEAARKAAEQVRDEILKVAGNILKINPRQLSIKDRVITGVNGKNVTVAQVALHSLYVENQQQISATVSWIGAQTPAFAAQGAEVEIDTETGVVHVLKAISAVDVGHVINPVLAEGVIEGSVALALGYSISEEMLYDQRGNLLTTNLSDYRILNASDMPELKTYLVETDASEGPFGAKAFEDIAVNALAPAVANAVADALGVRLRQIPLTPERVLRVLRAQAQARNAL